MLCTHQAGTVFGGLHTLSCIPGLCAYMSGVSVLVLFHSKRNTQERAVILLHRYFQTNSSTKCTGLDKWVSTAGLLRLHWHSW
jgi:hypothetical protein